MVTRLSDRPIKIFGTYVTRVLLFVPSLYYHFQIRDQLPEGPPCSGVGLSEEQISTIDHGPSFYTEMLRLVLLQSHDRVIVQQFPPLDEPLNHVGPVSR